MTWGSNDASSLVTESGEDITLQVALILGVLGQPDRVQDLGWAMRWGWGTPRSSFWSRFCIAYIRSENAWRISAPVPSRAMSFEELLRRLQSPFFRYRYRIRRPKLNSEKLDTEAAQ